MKSPAIIDVFMYNGEPIAELRIALMSPHVDEIVLVESKITFSGNVKTRFYCEVNRTALVNAARGTKLTFLGIEAFPEPDAEWNEKSKRMPFVKPETRHMWFREQYQRNFCYDYVKNNYNEFVAFVCDADEIPAESILKNARINHSIFHEPVHLEMMNYVYNFRWVSRERWRLAFVVNEAGFVRDLNSVRTGVPSRICHSAGAHCTYFMSASEIARKLKSFSHGEYAAFGDDVNAIATSIERGEDVMKRAHIVLENNEKFHLMPKAFRDFNAKIEAVQSAVL